MIQKETFFHFIRPEYLYSAALFFIALTIVLVGLVYLQLYLKKRNFKVVSDINEQINLWIGEMLMEQEIPAFQLTPELRHYIRKEKNREFLIDNLIKIRKNLTGAPAKNIVGLYLQLGLKRDSMKRFRSVVWHRKAKGIYELYMMGQDIELPDIYRYTNSANEYVRMEAQTAIVGLLGFEGLRFLDTLEYPLHEWQQLKLLEQLSTLDSLTMNHLPEWLESGNEYVVHFALKLADVYQQMEVHDTVLPCLESSKEEIRCQAIKTLGRIAGDATPDILVRHYPGETPRNKKEILKQLMVIGNEAHIPFLENALNEEDDSLKLEALSALAVLSSTTQALDKYQADETLASIIKQVKYELNI